LPIDEKLIKKLRVSATVTKTTLQNTLKNKLGWPDTKVQESWDREVLITEYYTALMQQKMAVSPEVQLPARSPGSPIAPPASSRSAGPAKSAPPPAKGTAKQAKVSNAASSDAIQEETETFPPPSRAAVAAKPPATTIRQRGQGSTVHSDTALQQSPRNSKKTQAVKSRDSCFGTTLKLLFVIVVAFFFVIYLVHGFEGGNQKLIAGAQSNMLENYTGLVLSTFDQLIAMVTAFVKPVSDLLAKLTETAVVSAAPPTTKDGLGISAKQAEKEPVVSKPTVTATVKSVDTKNAQQKEAEMAKQYEERRKIAEAAEKQKAAEAAEKQKAENEAREAEAVRQRQVEQKRREEEEEKKAALEKVKKAEEARKAQEARAQQEAEKEAQQKRRDTQPKSSKPKPAQAQTQANSQAKKEPSAQKKASPSPPLPPQQQASPPPPPPTPSQPTPHSDDELKKIMKEDCGQFDVYDCDVKFPKHFDACRTKKAECDKKSRAKTPTGEAKMTTSAIE
jgi:hypothetical protein